MLDEITVRTEAADSLVAVRLVEAMVAEMEELYELPGAPGWGPARRRRTSPRRGGTFLVLYAGGRPVAGGGVKRDADGVAEIKRMYVVPEARRQGLGRRLLEALEDAARELRYRAVRLDTGARQPHAQAMYERAGYHPIGNYNDNSQASFWGEKILR